MKKNFYHVQRVEKKLKIELSIIFHRKIEDPRFKNVTISDVNLSNDLKYAKVFIIFLNYENNFQSQSLINKYIKILNKNILGFIYFLLGKRKQSFSLPKITFFYDNSFLNGNKLFNLIKSISA